MICRHLSLDTVDGTSSYHGGASGFWHTCNNPNHSRYGKQVTPCPPYDDCGTCHLRDVDGSRKVDCKPYSTPSQPAKSERTRLIALDCVNVGEPLLNGQAASLGLDPLKTWIRCNAGHGTQTELGTFFAPCQGICSTECSDFVTDRRDQL